MRNDVELQRDVLEELDWEPSVHASDVGVTTHEGVVTLRGHVVTHTQKHAAESVAKRVNGVRAVVNELEVRPSEHHRRDDEDIAEAAVHALEWDGSVPDDRVQVTVHDALIDLDGAVVHRYEREAAERAVRHLVGVRGVNNRIVVEPLSMSAVQLRSGSQIKAQIESCAPAQRNTPFAAHRGRSHGALRDSDRRCPFTRRT